MSDLARRAALAIEAEFADLLVRTHRRLGGDPRAVVSLRDAAARAWRASAEGHVCVALDDATVSLLTASPVVSPVADSTASVPPATPVTAAPEASRESVAPVAPVALAAPAAPAAPLVLEDRHLYLNRLWHAEDVLARDIAALDAPAPIAAPARIAAEVDRLCCDGGIDARQRAAIETALARRLTVVSGGPGTGKTTTLARLIVAAARLAPQLRVAIAAPTGRAAARLSGSLLSQLPQLDPDPALRLRLPDAGMTLHRLLGLRGDGSPAGRAPAGPLPFDMVIVDEASMLDLELARRLVASIGIDARLVLCGDKDQLASVEAGAVFAALSALGGARGALGEAVVLLERNYRQRAAPGIAALAAQMRDGAVTSVAAGDDLDFRDAATPDAVIADALAGYAQTLDAAGEGADAAALLAGYGRFRILSALRSGPLGADALNAAIGARIRRRLGVDPAAEWFAGRQVTVARNAPGLGLFNGDTGVCARVDGRLLVEFPAAAGARRLSPVQVPPVREAWVSTVHTAQGSEFDTVSFVPAPAGHPLASRELVYTALTRARLKLVVYGPLQLIAEAAARPVLRTNLLAARIARLKARAPA